MLDEKLLPRYGAKVTFVHRDFPLAKHAWAMRASLVARYFQTISVETAIGFRRETMKSLTIIESEKFNDWVTEFCEPRHLDAAKALGALGDEALRAAIKKDVDDGTARGVAHTPTALVNGVPFIETFTFEEISKAIDVALKENGIE
jgi:protein-disulfide isomerase